jgi:hypothetical protein
MCTAPSTAPARRSADVKKSASAVRSACRSTCHGSRVADGIGTARLEVSPRSWLAATMTRRHLNWDSSSAPWIFASTLSKGVNLSNLLLTKEADEAHGGIQETHSRSTASDLGQRPLSIRRLVGKASVRQEEPEWLMLRNPLRCMMYTYERRPTTGRGPLVHEYQSYLTQRESRWFDQFPDFSSKI